MNPLVSVELALRIALVFAESATPEQRQQIVGMWIANTQKAQSDFDAFSAWIKEAIDALKANG